MVKLCLPLIVRNRYHAHASVEHATHNRSRGRNEISTSREPARINANRNHLNN